MVSDSAIQKDTHLVNGDLIDYMEEAIITYGEYILEDRSIPDFRDGLKPVHRHILWSAYKLGVHGYKRVLRKSAKIVGDTHGNFHPHGEEAIYKAMVVMTHLCEPTMYGSGNFGSLLRDAAQQRYTEARLSEYSDKTFFNSLYTKVIDYAPSYDGSNEVPVILPSSLPNLLVNGTFGIGLGARCTIPAFEIKGLLKVTKHALKGNRITPNFAMKHLVPRSPFGATPFLETDEWRDNLKSFFETGIGSIYWSAEAEYNHAAKSVSVTGFPPIDVKNLKNKVIERIADLPFVKELVNESYIDKDKKKKHKFTINLKQNVPREEVDDRLYQCVEKYEGSQSLFFTITERFPVEEGTDKVPVQFSLTNITEFFEKWSDWRIGLERRAIIYERDQVRGQITRDRLLLKAVENIDVIYDSWQSDDPVETLMDGLDITEEEANEIRNLRIRQLEKLEAEALRDRIKEGKEYLVVLREQYDEPVPRIYKIIDAGVA